MHHYLVRGVWKLLSGWDRTRFKAKPLCLALRREKDIPYREKAHPKQQLDLFWLENAESLPLLIYFHGGGWVHGSKERQYENYAEHLAAKGFLVANANYRLAPQNPYPAQIEDGLAVMNFLKKRAKTYGWDGKNVFLCGDSAGANLAALLALSPECALPVTAMGLICGIYDYHSFVHNTHTPFARQHMQALFGTKDYEALPHYRGSFVTENITSAFPPSYLLSSAQDIVRKETEKMEKLLAKVGVSHVCNILPASARMRHVDQLRLSLPLSEKLMEELTDFFHQHQKPLP